MGTQPTQNSSFHDGLHSVTYYLAGMLVMTVHCKVVGITQHMPPPPHVGVGITPHTVLVSHHPRTMYESSWLVVGENYT